MTTRRALAVPVAVLGALVLPTALAGPAQAAGPRYASPTGTNAQNCLTPATACSIEKAIGGASTNDDITVLPGSYSPTTVLASGASGVNVHGLAGQPRPVVYSTAPTALSLSGNGVKVSELAIRHTGSQYGLNLFTTSTTVQRVDVRSSGGGVACSPGISGVIRDSLCVSTGATGIALDDSFGGGSGTLLLRNVTAIATGAGSIGIRADSSGNNTDINVDARNVIASGVTADLSSTEVGINSESDIVLQTSNYRVAAVAGGGFVTPAGTGTNQTAAPVFADPSFHQARTSPTIDAGATDASTGTLDYDDQARPAGAAIDIGADEFYPDVVAPDTLMTHHPKRRTHHRRAVFVFDATEPSTFVCKVDRTRPKPCASPFRSRFKRFGKHTVTVTAVDASGNVDATPVSWTWRIKHTHAHRHPHPHARGRHPGPGTGVA